MDEKLRILLCEDDENLGMLLREYLQAKGYVAELYPDGEAGYKAFLKNKYDICVFDVMMPKKDGFTLAQEVRAANAEIPIIFLTAKTLKDDILEGFKIGADDYITKPFSMEELTFRIEAILRRVRGKKNKESNMYKIGKFTFDTQKQILSTPEKQTKLTTKESELLSLLCAHANEILQRDFALKTIWIDDNYFNARSMDVYITKLRKHLKEDPSIEIINIHGKGLQAHHARGVTLPEPLPPPPALQAGQAEARERSRPAQANTLACAGRLFLYRFLSLRGGAAGGSVRSSRFPGRRPSCLAPRPAAASRGRPVACRCHPASPCSTAAQRPSRIGSAWSLSGCW